MTTDMSNKAAPSRRTRRRHAAKRARRVVGGLSVAATAAIVVAMVDNGGGSASQSGSAGAVAEAPQVIVRVHRTADGTTVSAPVVAQAPVVVPTARAAVTESRGS